MITPKTQRPLEILMAYDGSNHAQAAVELLGDLPLPPGSAVSTVAVFTPRQIGDHVRLQSGLDEVEAQLKAKGLAAKTELLLGYPAEKVIEYAEGMNPDMIVVGAKGLRATLGILLGGVAQQIVEYASWPVLVVRAPYKGIRRALLVTDGSPCSQRAVEYLGESLLPGETQVYVMHVLPPPLEELISSSWPAGAELLTPMPPPTPAPPDDMQVEEECRGREILAGAVKELQAHGIEAKSVLLRGDAATEILEYILDKEIDLVVSGSRGMASVKGWLLGSVSRKLIHYATCSVLVVKGSACRVGPAG